MRYREPIEFKDLPIIKKAFWVIDPNMYESTYYRSPSPEQGMGKIVFSINHSSAKSQCSEYGKFIDIKCVRTPEYDIVNYKNQELKRNEIAEKLRVETRNAKLLALPENELYLVQNGYVGNAVLWWGLNNCGYVCDINKAQRYTKEEIVKQFTNGRMRDVVWTESHVLQHIKQIVDGQNLSGEFCV